MSSFRRSTVYVAALCAVALSPIALPSTVSAQSGSSDGSPVTIDSCGPVIDKNATQTIAGIPVASQSRGIAIEFVNDAAKTADLVNFNVDSNGERFVIRDVGTFSPGVSIKHRYGNGSGQAFVLPQLIAPNISCSVASVKFVDGSLWRKGQGAIAAAPSAPSTPHGPAALTANPARLDIDRDTDSELFLISSSERITAFKETDDCAGVATVFVAATGQSSATYSVRPLAAGSCRVLVTDEAGATLSVPITVR